MKKVFLLTAFAVFTFVGVSAQSFNVGVNVGLPIGDVQDGYIVNVGLDANYLFEVSEKFEAGLSAGYSHFLGDSVGAFGFSADVDDAGFIPVAAAARFNLTEEITLGADLGYAVGVAPDENDGGIYYAPKVQYGFTDTIGAVLSYRAVSIDGGGTFSSINIGAEFSF